MTATIRLTRYTAAIAFRKRLTDIRSEHVAAAAGRGPVGAVEHLRAAPQPPVVVAGVDGDENRQLVVFGAEARAVAPRVRFDAVQLLAVELHDRDVRIVEVHVRAFLAQPGDDLERGRFTAVGDAGLVRHS